MVDNFTAKWKMGKQTQGCGVIEDSGVNCEARAPFDPIHAEELAKVVATMWLVLS